MPLSTAVYEQEFSAFHDATLKGGRFKALEKYPCLNDIDSSHDYSGAYLYHTAWASKILMRTRPREHSDFGSFMYWVASAAAICPVTFYDIRPADVAIPGLTLRRGDLTQIPVESNSLVSASCLHVMEHIGLGRYGDTVDIDGDLKAAAELSRVIVPGGQLLMVLPVGRPRVVFNAHRIYSYEMVLDMFPGFALKEFSLMLVPEYIENANPARVAGLSEAAGCFWFIKK